MLKIGLVVWNLCLTEPEAHVCVYVGRVENLAWDYELSHSETVREYNLFASGICISRSFNLTRIMG